jgi:hypothetical protein
VFNGAWAPLAASEIAELDGFDGPIQSEECRRHPGSVCRKSVTIDRPVAEVHAFRAGPTERPVMPLVGRGNARSMPMSGS